MSQNVKVLAATTGQGDPPVGDPPVDSRHKQVATRVLTAVMAAKGEVSPLEPRDPTVLPFVRANSAVDVTFMLGVVGIVKTNPQLQGLTVTLDIAAVEETIDYIQAYVPVINELEAFLQSLKFSVAARKADIGAQTLRTYQAIKSLARDKKLDLTTHAATLKRSLALGRKSKRNKAPTPTTPQAPMATESGKEEAKV